MTSSDPSARAARGSAEEVPAAPPRKRPRPYEPPELPVEIQRRLDAARGYPAPAAPAPRRRRPRSYEPPELPVELQRMLIDAERETPVLD